MVIFFLTANLVDDIDEAIVSRCIALIKVNPPGRDDRRRIWAVMTEQFGLILDLTLLEELPDIFPGTNQGHDCFCATNLSANVC